VNPRTSQPDHLFKLFGSVLLDILERALSRNGDNGDARSTATDIARSLFDTLKPRDVLEAMLAARLVAAHCAAIDGYARATQPEVAEVMVLRLRANAAAVSRSFDAALRTLARRRAPVAQPRAERPAAPPARQSAAAPKAEPPPTIPGWPAAMAQEQRRNAWCDTTSLTTAQAPDLAAHLATCAADGIRSPAEPSIR